LVKECPDSILPTVLSYLGEVYGNLKDKLLDNFASKYSSKERELVWGKVTEFYNDILFPLIEAADRINKSAVQPPSNTLNLAINKYCFETNDTACSETHTAAPPEQHVKKSYWPNPTREINFIQIRSPDDVATIMCKIYSMPVPYALIDSGSNESLISDNIAEATGHTIDKSNITPITGIASKANVIGTVYDLPVTIGSGDDAITIRDNFSVVKAERNRNGDYKSLVLFGTPWLNKIGWEPIANREFKVNHNGKRLTIPLSVHKSQREVFTIEKTEEKKS
jgi:hypothetical protein